MRILHKIIETLVKVDWDNGRYLERQVIGATHAEYLRFYYLRLAGGNCVAVRLALRQLAVLHLYWCAVRRFLALRLARQAYVSDLRRCRSPHSEFHSLIANRIQFDNLLAVAYNCHSVRYFQSHIDIAHTLLRGEHRSRHIHLLIAAYHSRQSGCYHKRPCHKHALVGTAEGFAVGGDNHDAYAAVVVRHIKIVCCGLAFIQCARPYKLHNRFETVRRWIGVIRAFIVAANREHLLNLSSIST